MDKTISVKNSGSVRINTESSTGTLELTVLDRDGKSSTVQIANGDVMTIAMELLKCVEYVR